MSVDIGKYIQDLRTKYPDPRLLVKTHPCTACPAGEAGDLCVSPDDTTNHTIGEKMLPIEITLWLTNCCNPISNSAVIRALNQTSRHPTWIEGKILNKMQQASAKIKLV